MRGIDFSSWQTMLTTLLGLGLVTLVGVGLRLLVMQTVQQRRERANRQINERLKALIAAYKTLGGSFTGVLDVDPTHLRQLRQRAATAHTDPREDQAMPTAEVPAPMQGGSDRARRIRDAVEAALSDIVLLGTDEQVRLAALAAGELVAGRPIHTQDLVVSLRDYIREALDLSPIPTGVVIPRQGPARPAGAKGKDAGRSDDAPKQRGGGNGAGGGGGGGGMGGLGTPDDEQAPHR